jgi:hypothetical protein
MAFIDGDHRVPGAFKDWSAVDRVLRPGGIILLHDTVPNKCGWLGPRFLLEQLSLRPDHYQGVNLPTPEGFGLAIIQNISTGDHRAGIPTMRSLLANKLYEKIRGDTSRL